MAGRLLVRERGYVSAGPRYNDDYWYKGHQIYSAREPVRCEYHVRHLERPALGTSYVDVVERIVELMEALADPQLALAVDTTGVSRLVRDMLNRCLNKWLEANYQRHITAAWITITGEDSVTKVEGGGLRVPKRDLASAPLVLMQNKQLKIAQEMPLALKLCIKSS